MPPVVVAGSLNEFKFSVCEFEDANSAVQVETPGNTVVACGGSRVAVGSFTGLVDDPQEIRLYQLIDPSAPTLLGSTRSAVAGVAGVALFGTRVAVLGLDGRVELIDWADPDAPRSARVVDTSVVGFSWPAPGAFPTTSLTAYASIGFCDTDAVVVGVQNGPPVAARVDFGTGQAVEVDPAFTTGIGGAAVAGDPLSRRIAIGNMNGTEIVLLDGETRAELARVDLVDTAGAPLVPRVTSVAISGELVIAASDQGGPGPAPVVFVNFGVSPATVTAVDPQYSSGTSGSVVAIAGSVGAFGSIVATGTSEVRLVDVSDPADPQVIDDAVAANLASIGSLALVANVVAQPVELRIACEDPDGQPLAEIDFGSAELDGPPVRRTFVVRNTGNAPVEVASVAPSAAPDVAVALPAGAAWPLRLSAGERSAVLTAALTPATEGPLPDAAVLTFAGDVGLTLPLRGSVVARHLSLPASVSFGRVPVGQTASLRIAAENAGGLDTTIADATTSGAPFFEDVAPPVVVPAGSSADLVVRFEAPAAEGESSGTLTVASDAREGALVVALQGEACVPRPQVAIEDPPDTLDFGEIERGFRTARTIRIRNDGSGVLSLRARVDGGPGFGVRGVGDELGEVATDRAVSVPPAAAVACGGGGTDDEPVTAVVVEFFAGADPRDEPYAAELLLEDVNVPGATLAPVALRAKIVPPIPVTAVLALDASRHMDEDLGGQPKRRSVAAAARLLIELLRPAIGDEAAIVKFEQTPSTVAGLRSIDEASRAELQALIPAGGFDSSDPRTSIAAGLIGARDAIASRLGSEPKPPLVLCITDGKEDQAYWDEGRRTMYSLRGGWVYPPVGAPPGEPGSPLDWLADLLGWNRPPKPGTVPTEEVPTGGSKLVGIALGTAESVGVGQLRARCDDLLVVSEAVEGAAKVELLKHLTRVYMGMVGSSEVLDPAHVVARGETLELPFRVNSDDVGLFVAIYDSPGRPLPFALRTPHGELLSLDDLPAGMQIRRGATGAARFVELRLPLDADTRRRYVVPGEANDWHLVVRNTGTFASVDGTKKTEDDEPVTFDVLVGTRSHVSMTVLAAPRTLRTGEPIELTARLAELERPLPGGDVEVFASAPGGETYPPIRLEEREPGTYAATFSATARGGTYSFRFRGTGRTQGEPFVREAYATAYVADKIDIEPLRSRGGLLGFAGTLVRVAVKVVRTVVAALLEWWRDWRRRR